MPKWEIDRKDKNDLRPSLIVLADESGFCFGVEKAVSLAFDIISDSEKVKKIYMYGELIHNKGVVDELLNKGMSLVQSVQEIDNDSIVLLRAHGITVSEQEELSKKNCKIVDGTCAYVKRAQKFARNAADNDSYLVITGDPAHAEVRGLVSHYESSSHGTKAIVIQTEAEANKLELVGKPTVLMSQTTFSAEIFNKICQILENKIENLTKFATICNATEIRQSEARSLAEASDLMIVIGGKHSSNTRKLSAVCSQCCGEVYQIEYPSEIRQLLAEGLLKEKSVGITAGASTPRSIISEVIQIMKEFNEVQNETNEVSEVSVGTEAAQVTEATQEGTEVADASVEGQLPPELMSESSRDSVAEGAKEEESSVLETEESKVSVESETSSDQHSDVSFTDFIDNIPHIKRGETVEGVIVRYDSDFAYVDVRDKSEGKIPMREFTSDPDFDLDKHIADRTPIEVFIKSIRSTQEGKEILLSKQRVDQVKSRKVLEQAYKDKEPVTVRVTNVVKDGVIASYSGCDVYIHRTQLEPQKVDDLEPYRDQTLDVLITQFDTDRRRPRIAASRRALLNVVRRKQAKAVWDSLEVGDIYEGVVRSTTPFGAFVDIGGVDGLVHISELSWNRIRDPKEVVNVGDKIQVYVKEFDKEKKRISLGFKRIEDDPYYNIEERFPVGSIVKGKVVRMFDFGAFIELDKDVDALCHISQISNLRLNKPNEVLKEGMEVEAKVMDVSYENRRISVSIKEVAPIDELLDPVAAAKRKQEAEFPTSYRDDAGTGADIQITHVNKEDEEA